MDAVVFPPPPAPFIDDDLDFGDFAFSSAAPQPPLADPRPAAAAFAAFDDDWGDFVAGDLGSSAGPTAAAPSWEKPRGPLPLSLFGADEDDGDGGPEKEEEGPAGPPPTATARQHATSLAAGGARQADLKDLIAGLYGSQPPPAAGPASAGARQEAAEEEGDQGFGDDDWEFTAAAGPADRDGGGRGGRGDGIAGNVEDITKSLSTDQEEWSSFTSVDEKLNHVHQTTAIIAIHESTGESVKASTYSPANSSAILDLYKESERAESIHIAQGSAESLQSSSALFHNNDMKSSFRTDENQSSRSTSDGILIEFYHRLREESLIVISRHVKDLRDAQKVSTPSDENSKAAGIAREIQEIYDKLKDYSLPEGFCTEEHPLKDICITELLNYTKEEHLKDFEHEHCLAEKIARALEDVNIAVELYKHSVSTLQTLKLLSKEEQGDYVSAWYSLLLPCAQELQHGAALWRESYCAKNICDRVISEGGHYFIALGEIYRVAQILYFSMQCFKPWVLAVPGMLSKMLSCLDSCTSSWNSGLETALKMVVDTKHLDASVAIALMESIKNITKLEVLNLQKNIPNEMQCRLTLLPTSLVPGLKVVMWNADHCFVKVANLWANRISPDPPQLSGNATSSIKKAAMLTNHAE